MDDNGTGPSGNSCANPSPCTASRTILQRRRILLQSLAVLALALGGAGSAAAQGVNFNAAGGLRLVRAAGTAEPVSGVALFANASGTIKSGSTITVNYGVAIEPGTGVVICTAAACVLGVNFTVGIAGNAFTITFATDVAFANGDSLAIGAVRLDVSSSFGLINAILSSAGEPIGNLITFNPVQVPVANVLSPPTTVLLTAASPLSVCSPSAKAFSVKITEAFSASFTSAVDENAFSNVGAPGVDPMGAGELDTTLRLAFTNIPEDVTITFTGFGGSGTLTPATSFVSFTATSGSQSVNVDVALTATDPASVENVIVNFTASATAYTPGTGAVSVSLRGGTASPNVPRFAANVQGSGNILSVVGPTISGVVNNASFLLRAVAPGSQASLFGNCVATGTLFSETIPLPTALGGTSVTFNEIAAPLFGVFLGQINLQIPWELAGQTQASVVVTVNGVSSAAFIVQIAPTDPGLFTVNSSGTGQGTILIGNTNIYAAPEGSIPEARPANQGEFVVIFCTGLGAVSNQPASGAASSSDPLSHTILPPTVTIGGIPAAVQFSGLSPGFVALYQVVVTVPPADPGGDAVPLVITINGVESNTVTMAITGAAKRRRGQIISE